LTALKSNSNTVWFNFQTYIYIYLFFFLFSVHVWPKESSITSSTTIQRWMGQWSC